MRPSGLRCTPRTKIIKAMWPTTPGFSPSTGRLSGLEGIETAVSANMSFERYEVATIAAAQERGSNYCPLAHGRALSRELDLETVLRIGNGTDEDPERQAISALARKVAANPAQVTAADFAPLRDRGFSDAELLDVVLATAIRCFFSTVLQPPAPTGPPARPGRER